MTTDTDRPNAADYANKAERDAAYAAERIAELRDMLAALHFEALGFVRREGSSFDMAMSRVEREFGADLAFNARFGKLEGLSKLFGTQVVKLSVPGMVDGWQHITVTFASGGSVEVKSLTIDGAWQSLREAAENYVRYSND